MRQMAGIVVVIILLVVTVTGNSLQAGFSEQQSDGGLAQYAPDRILFKAQRSELWSPSSYPVNYEYNPYYLRGDFNGDGENDLAFWITAASSGKRGIAIIHSSLDTLWIFGAGHPFGGTDQIWTDTWSILPKGTTLRPWRSIPEIGMIKGENFVFQQEAVSPVWIAKSSFAIYWKDGKYHYVPVAD